MALVVEEIIENILEMTFLKGLFPNIQGEVLLFNQVRLTTIMWTTRQVELKNN